MKSGLIAITLMGTGLFADSTAIAQDSLNVTKLGQVDLPQVVLTVAVQEDRAFVANSDFGLRLMDISNPAQPTQLDEYVNSGDIYDVSVSGNSVYVADYYFQIIVLELINQNELIPRNSCTMPGNVYNMTLSGDYLYVSTGDAGMQIVNATPPEIPMIIGSYDTPGYVAGITVEGNLAYISDGDALRIIDVSSPLNPFEVGNFNVDVYGGSTMEAALNGDYAYVSIANGILILNISVPATPLLVGSYFNIGSFRGIAYRDGYVYCAHSDFGFDILDVHDPANPVRVGYYDTPYYALDLCLDENYLYLADQTNFGIYDCSAALPVYLPDNSRQPHEFKLSPAFPNPFNPTTTFRIELPMASLVTLKVYNASGKSVATVLEGWHSAGYHEATFDGSDLSSGLYFARLAAGEFLQMQKMILLK